MDNLTTAYSTHQKLKALNELKKDQTFAVKVNFYAQVFFTLATWIIYLLFAASMYAAPLWVLQSFFGSNAGNVLAISVLGVFLLVFPTALALGKHAGYHALSKKGVDVRYIGIIVGFFIASGVYLEMTSASSQQQEKANHAVEVSNAGKSIMETQVNNSASTGYAELIAKASQLHEQCLVKLAIAKKSNPNTKFHCNGDKGKLESLKAQASLERESVNAANTAAITVKQEALQKERDAQALPIAKMFQELLGSTIATGAIVAAFIAALIFEISHSLTIFNEIKLQREKDELSTLLNKTETDYFSETGKQYDGKDFQESEILDLAEMRKSGKVKHFNDRLSDGEPLPNNVELEKKPFGFGFIPEKEPASARSGNTLPPSPSKPYTVGFTEATRANPLKTVQPARTTGDCIQASVEDARTHARTMEEAYQHAQGVKVKHSCNCPVCGEVFIKSNVQHLFCSNNRNKFKHGGKDCATKYWALVKPERQIFAMKHKR